VSRELTNSRINRVGAKPFRFEMNGVHLGESLIAWNRYSTHVDVSSGVVEDTVAFVLGDRLPVFRVGEGSVACTPATGVVVSPSTMSIERPAGSSVLVLRTSYQALERRFREVTGHAPKGRIRFEPMVDISSGLGATASRSLRHVVSELETNDVLLKNRSLRVAMDDMLLGTLLSLPHTHSDQLFIDPGHAAPNIVQRAEEYLEAHAAEPIRIRDIVDACGCSSSLLYRSFQRYRGCTPSDFLRSQRLASAHRMLLSPSQSDTVKSIALACGFPHLGRFAASYKRRFGESPSDTLRRSR
jgi:AraC-like DNA-binding protein